MRDQATRCNPVKSVFGVTRRVLIYRLPRRREAKAAVLSRRVDVDLLVYSQRIALSAKIREIVSRKAFFGPRVIHFSRNPNTLRWRRV